jgi:hypothetical protein
MAQCTVSYIFYDSHESCYSYVTATTGLQKVLRERGLPQASPNHRCSS